MSSNITTDDYVAIQNVLGEYQWHVDDGDSDGWADLWTEDGAFIGGATEPFVGREELKKVPAWVKSGWDGGLRHQTGSVWMRYGKTRDEAIVKYYNLVTTWNEEVPRLFTFALSEMRLVRRGDGWKIATNTVRNLAPTRKHGDTE